MDYSCKSNIRNANDNYIWNIRNGEAERDKGFFIKPRIKFDKVRARRPDPMITITSDSHGRESFDGIVWTLPVSNKELRMFSKDTSNCHIGIEIMENKTSRYDREIPLSWLRDNQLPTRCSMGTSLSGSDRTIREQYADELPFAYLNSLHYSTHTSLDKGGKDASVFLFTFCEGQSLSIIPAFGFTKETLAGLSLSFNTEYDVTVRFHSNEYNHKDGKRFKLIANSWDDVRFKRTRI